MIERLQQSEKEKTGLFGKGTFGRKLLVTLALITAGLAVGLSTGREISSFASA